MTDHKFTDDEVIKALECCAKLDFSFEECEKCPYKSGCGAKNNMPEDALALINRQKAEIEALKIANEKMYAANKEQEAEIEKLKGQKRVLVLFWKEENKKLKTAKAEAIKEFAERLVLVEETTAINCATNERVVRVMDIDNLVKEMTEGQNESQNT